MTPPGPIFLLSAARSGSTLTRIILDTHPEIYSPSELELGQLASNLCFSIGLLEGANDEPLHNREAMERTRTMLSDLLGFYTRRKGKRIWCEKSPANAAFEELLAGVFPEARFICLYRDARDVVHSLVEVFRHGIPADLRDYVRRCPGDPLQAAMRHWVDTTERLLESERRHPARTFRLRYEDMVAEPAGTLAPLFRFLDLEWDPASLAAVFSSRHDRGGGDPNVFFSDRIRQDSVGAGRDVSTATLPAPLRERMLELLAELGYPETLERLATTAVAGPAEASSQNSLQKSERDPRWVFETLLPERAAAARALPPAPFSCDVTVRGQGGGAWSLEWAADGLFVTPDHRGLPARIELSSDDLLAVVHGQVNPMRLAQEGRIRVKGIETDEALRGLIRMMSTSE